MKNASHRQKTRSLFLLSGASGLPLFFNLFLTLILVVLNSSTSQAQYLHASGKKILDGNNQEITLRGMGLGGWMVQEGYMLQTASFANAQYQIKAKIKDLIGDANTQTFYDAWLANHVTKRDVDSLAKWGFNSIRLPMHYNLYTLPIEQEPVPGQQTWLDKGFVLTDSLLKWCKANHMYLILDLHAAPGGQGKDAAIADYDPSKPSLWESDANKQKTIALWKKLAERYANEPSIGGYDLINETNWNFTAGKNEHGCDETTNAPLRQLFIDITAAIRQVDTHHLIFIEGNCWANNHNGLFPAWDNNLAASFHKYWNYNDKGSIQGLLNMRDTYNIPLWLGESGENSNNWFTDAIELAENNSIGWAWWPFKKIEGINSPFSVVKTDDYATLLNYWTNPGTTPKPSAATAQATLMQLAENLKVQHVDYHKDIPDAMIRQVKDKTAKPFVKQVVPGVVHATDFDLGRSNIAYWDKDSADYHVTTGTFTAWNNGYLYRNDAVDIEKSMDVSTSANGYDVGWTNDGEWMQYSIDVDSSAAYKITVRYAAATAGSQIRFTVNNYASSSAIDLPATNGFQTWGEKVVDDVLLDKGRQRFRFIFNKGGANVGYFKFELSKKQSEVPFSVLTAETDTNGSFIYLSLNKAVDPATVTSTNGFTLSVNGGVVALQSVAVNGSHGLVIKTAQSFGDGDVLLISYNENIVKSSTTDLLSDFTNLSVKNNLPLHVLLPAKIEAEAFHVNQGLVAEACSDTGGGQDLGYTNNGDYLDYFVRVPITGSYPFEARIACNANAGRIKVQQLSHAGTELNSINVDIPVTGGWQNWQSVTAKINLTEGTGVLRVTILQPEFNMNWFKFGTPSNVAGNERDQGSLQLYPNPSDGQLHIDFPSEAYSLNNSLMIRSMSGAQVDQRDRIKHDELLHVDVGNLPAGLYIVEFRMNGKQWRNKVFFN